MTAGASTLTPELRQRVLIENVLPQIDAGRFPIKRCVGEPVRVEATIHTDGIDRIAARVCFRFTEERAWQESPLRLVNQGLDLWQGEFTVQALGRWLYQLQAWIDDFATWREKISKKFNAGQDVEQDLQEGGILVGAAARQADGAEARWLSAAAEVLKQSGDPARRAGTALSEKLETLMARYAPRDPITTFRILGVRVERPRARTGAWYEFFPRSAGTTEARSATLREAEARLAGIAAMGFDVVYLPPIHPIGLSFRKGPNNVPQAGPHDPGSPWAIGSAEGGHMDVHPELGTLADVDHFVSAAAALRLEVALDLAYQCSPDHPYTREHPEWFHRRPDGSIHYAENPPKKYEDIYPFDFECEEWRALWLELKAIVDFWIAHGVKIFRVDNPHTKPIRFWEWLINETLDENPDVVFLGEAFTRPAVMDSLAKIGFSQSYTYFTWRNTKPELTEYLTDLTQTDIREYFRPNFFTNTPDILTAYLQQGGRAAFQIRAVLAATLAASYGVYGPPYELCEAQAFPGTEDYVGSEKYQIRVWDWESPGNIKPLLTRLNAIRHDEPALQVNTNLEFLEVDNPQLVAYVKTDAAGAPALVMVVNLDPHNTQSGWLQLPRGRWGLPDAFEVTDRLTDTTFRWDGDAHFIRLAPSDPPAHILKVNYAKA